MLVGQLIEILKQFDQDREVMIHTLSGQNAEVKGYFPKDDEYFYLTDMEEFYEDDDYMSPQGNGGRATHEIYSAKDDVLLYSNKDNV